MNLCCGVLDRHVGGTLIDAVSTKDTFDWYEYILKVRSKRNNDEVNAKTKVRESEGQFSKNSIKLDTLFYSYLKCVNNELRQLFGGEPEQILNLDSYLNYVDEIFRRISADKQNVALKIALASVRSLDFPLTDKSKAEKVFMTEPEQLQKGNVVDFENFLMHYICQKSSEYNLPIQFHVATGPGGYNSYRNCSAGLLTGLILKHPKTKFDLMHGHENIATALLGIFDSQVCGGKRYDLATMGRRRANATYYAPNDTDTTSSLIFAMDLTPLASNQSMDIQEYIRGYIERFSNDVMDRLTKLRVAY